MNRRSWTSQMPDSINLKFDRFGHVMADQLKTRMTNPTRDVELATREVVIQTNHLFTSFHQAINQVRANEASTTSNQIARQASTH